MRYVIGIDAGGTKTVGLLADESGTIVRRTLGGGANLHTDGELAVEKALFRVLQDLDSPVPVSALCLGIAGADRADDRLVIRNLLRRLGLSGRTRVEHDAAIALVAGSPSGTGIVLIAGTGSIAFGVDPQGRSCRAGGWGNLLGDEGSAYWLGQGALRRTARAADGRGPSTHLTEKVCETLGVSGPPGLIRWISRNEPLRYRVAALAPLVQQAADEGDEVAGSVLDEAALHLSHAASAVARRLEFPEPFPLVLAGGAFRACPGLLPRVERALDLEGAEVAPLEGEPAEGAVSMALELLRGG